MASAISLLPSMDGIGSNSAVRGLGYGGDLTIDMDALEAHWTHILANDQCAKRKLSHGVGYGYSVLTGTDKICVDGTYFQCILV